MRIRRHEQSITVLSSPAAVFAFIDDHRLFSAHMSRSSWMMAGGAMTVESDDGEGRRVGSHLRMTGRFLGIRLFLDEVITDRNPPTLKAWRTVGRPHLVIIDNYSMAAQISPSGDGARLNLSIAYELPASWKTRWLGRMFAGTYARWCISQMLEGTREHFEAADMSSRLGSHASRA